MQQIKQNATGATARIPLRAVSSLDGLTEQTGVAFVVATDVLLSKAGAAEIAGGGTITEIGHGNYYYQPAAGENDTLGFLLVRVAHSGVLTFVGEVLITAVNPYDAEFGLADLDATISSRLATSSYVTPTPGVIPIA